MYRDHCIYRRWIGTDGSRFGVDIDDQKAEEYTAMGWLPLDLVKPLGDQKHVVTALGDHWLTAPGNRKGPPVRGPVRGITAEDCMWELRTRKLWTSDFLGLPRSRGRVNACGLTS